MCSSFVGAVFWLPWRAPVRPPSAVVRGHVPPEAAQQAPHGIPRQNTHRHMRHRQTCRHGTYGLGRSGPGRVCPLSLSSMPLRLVCLLCVRLRVLCCVVLSDVSRSCSARAIHLPSPSSVSERQTQRMSQIQHRPTPDEPSFMTYTCLSVRGLGAFISCRRQVRHFRPASRTPLIDGTVVLPPSFPRPPVVVTGHTGHDNGHEGGGRSCGEGAAVGWCGAGRAADVGRAADTRVCDGAARGGAVSYGRLRHGHDLCATSEGGACVWRGWSVDVHVWSYCVVWCGVVCLACVQVASHVSTMWPHLTVHALYWCARHFGYAVHPSIHPSTHPSMYVFSVCAVLLCSPPQVVSGPRLGDRVSAARQAWAQIPL